MSGFKYPYNAYLEKLSKDGYVCETSGMTMHSRYSFWNKPEGYGKKKVVVWNDENNQFDYDVFYCVNS